MAIVVLLVSACSFGNRPRASTAPNKATVVRWLQGLDRNGVSFSLTGPVDATGHEKGGEIEMKAGPVNVVLYDGVLYGRRAGSSKWLEMAAEQANPLWPAARLSLIWESILLSPDVASPFTLGRNQLQELAAGPKVSRGVISIPPSLHRIEVRLGAVDSVFEVTGPGSAVIKPPVEATPGNVISLLTPGIQA